MIEFKVVPFAEGWDKAKHLIDEHFDDVSLAKGKLSLDVDVGLYEHLDAHGKLVTMLLMSGDEVAGYCVFITHDNHHRYKGKSYANNDVFFVSKKHRSGIDGVRVLRNINKYMKERFNIVTWHVKDKYDFSLILLKDGFVKQETVYAFFGE